MSRRLPRGSYLGGILVGAVSMLGVIGCAGERVDGPPPGDSSRATLVPGSTVPVDTTVPAGSVLCDRARAEVDLLRDPLADRQRAIVVFGELATVMPDDAAAAGLRRAAELFEQNEGATDDELTRIVSDARDDDATFEANLDRVPDVLSEECGVSIRSSSSTRPPATTTPRRAPTTVADSADLFEGGLRSYLAQNYGDQPWYDRLDRFDLSIIDDGGERKVQAGVGSSRSSMDVETATEICAAVVGYAGSSELDRQVFVTGEGDKIVVQTTGADQPCEAP